MKRIVGVILAALALAACAETPGGPFAPVPATAPPPPPPPPPSNPYAFNDADFAWSTAVGTGKVVGELAFRSDAAARYTCQAAVLAPETPWSRARMRKLYLSTTSADIPAEDVKSRTSSEHEAEYARYVREAPCNAAGRFTFSGLPDGAWYVITVAAPVGGGVRMAVMRRVVTDGQTVRVVLR
ncbi:MAG TPA: hypothetical protein VMU37_06570 [Caulobacteraceae bacterium]|nr:hypothetical protein [Caulobacteraceae bacterium]